MPDPDARAPGRGRYVCLDSACLAILAKRLSREGIDFARGEAAFRLAVEQSLVQNARGFRP